MYNRLLDKIAVAAAIMASMLLVLILILLAIRTARLAYDIQLIKNRLKMEEEYKSNLSIDLNNVKLKLKQINSLIKPENTPHWVGVKK